MSKSLITQTRAFSTLKVPAGFPTDTAVLFAPRDNVRQALLEAIDFFTVSITIAMFTLTDPEIWGALKTKMGTPGFAFQMSLDATEATTEPAMAAIIAEIGADPRVAVGSSIHGAYHHDKFFVGDHLYVGGGSTNWTVSGSAKEDNELSIRKSAPLAAWYETGLNADFARMKAAA